MGKSDCFKVAKTCETSAKPVDKGGRYKNVEVVSGYSLVCGITRFQFIIIIRQPAAFCRHRIGRVGKYVLVHLIKASENDGDYPQLLNPVPESVRLGNIFQFTETAACYNEAHALEVPI
ncbi:hypothetical protein N7519_007159 [Penicillium mononematosum]|uniref:uncharacterized protein n=1 Tax=Penicillium mononematosum TaxID=268346 RepID=UPI0025487A92|nr:uncharacterized protein N7519_007159 [Penicillium mononematosum]KAJ6185858.1 hypothetical protein N7519_007159 [Penicillium mononematosum]